MIHILKLVVIWCKYKLLPRHTLGPVTKYKLLKASNQVGQGVCGRPTEALLDQGQHHSTGCRSSQVHSKRRGEGDNR